MRPWRTVLYCAMPGPDPVTAAIERFTPRLVSSRAAGFARGVVVGRRPGVGQQGQGPLVLRLAARGLRRSRWVGARPRGALVAPGDRAVLSPGMVAMTPRRGGPCAPTCGPSPAALGPGAAVHRLGRERAKAPYTQSQITSYLALADAQPTEARRHRAAALIVPLGRGGAHRCRREGGDRAPMSPVARAGWWSRFVGSPPTGGPGPRPLSRTALDAALGWRAPLHRRDIPERAQRDEPAHRLACGRGGPPSDRDRPAASHVAVRGRPRRSGCGPSWTRPASPAPSAWGTWCPCWLVDEADRRRPARGRP